MYDVSAPLFTPAAPGRQEGDVTSRGHDAHDVGARRLVEMFLESSVLTTALRRVGDHIIAYFTLVRASRAGSEIAKMPQGTPWHQCPDGRHGPTRR